MDSNMMKMVFFIYQSPSFLYDSLAPKVNKASVVQAYPAACSGKNSPTRLRAMSKTAVFDKIVLFSRQDLSAFSVFFFKHLN